MRLNILIILLSILILSFSLIVACGDDDESIAGGLTMADDDDDSDDDSDDGCGISYGSSNCTDSNTEACASADLTNQDRKNFPDESACAPNLQWSAELAEVALAHSKDMCDRSFFAHDNPDGETSSDRIDNAGIIWTALGENLAMGTNLTASVANDMWMNEPICEPNHRSNLLSWMFTHIGVGVYVCGNDVYITQDFGTFSFDDIPDGGHPYCGGSF